MSTPTILKIPKGTVIAPPGGWQEQTYYVVERACRMSNVIHRAILYVGFIPPDSRPENQYGPLSGGYTSFMKSSSDDGDHMSPLDNVYIKGIAAIPGIGALEKVKPTQPIKWLGY